MRYRYLVFPLLGLLVGCQSLCPLRHLNPGASDINDPAARSQLGTDKMAHPNPLRLDEPVRPLPPSSVP